jgi:hypothetical protein
VTIGAASTDVLEDQAGVALRAAHLLMHAPQWISGLIVIEIRIRPDRSPTDCGVAVLAGNSDGAVRVGDLGLGRSRCLPYAARGLLRTRNR